MDHKLHQEANKKWDTQYKLYKIFGSTQAHNNVKILKHHIQTEMRTSYARYINTSIFSPDDDNQPPSCQKRSWSYIKNIRRDQVNITSLQLDTNAINDSLGKVKLLNKQFKSVFTSEPADGLADKGPSPYPTMPDIFVITEGIENLLNDLKIHKVCGPDTISARILKETSDIIVLILQIIFQISLNTGRVPTDWTTAYVTPIFKKGNHTLPSNYLPVPLTCITSKIFERIIVSAI